MIWTLPNTKLNISGIYAIINTANGKQYIGRANCLRRRYTRHLNDFKLKNHRNQHLQRAYEIYGSETFEFKVLEYLPKIELLAREQCYLDQIRHNRDLYYNISLLSSGPGNCMTEESRKKISATLMGHKHSKETIAKLVKASPFQPKVIRLVDPSGFVHDVHGIRDFCKEHNMSNSLVSKLISGEKEIYKGWYLEGTQNPKVKKGGFSKLHMITLISPDGIKYGPISNLSAFCKLHKLHGPEVYRIIKNHHLSTKGWKCIQMVNSAISLKDALEHTR